MIRIGQFATPQNAALVLAGRIGLHLKNQKSEKLLSLQKRCCSGMNIGERVIFTESLVLLYAVGRVTFDSKEDRFFYNENT